MTTNILFVKNIPLADIEKIRKNQGVKMSIIKIFVFLLLLIAIGFGCAVKEEGLTDYEAKKICDEYEQMWVEGNSAIATEILDTSYIMYSPFFPEGLKGIETLQGFIRNNSISFPDFKLKIDEYYVIDNIIFCHWTISGTNTGQLGELQATEKTIKVSGFAIAKVKNGKIYEEQTFWNVLEFYQQLGFQVIPPAVEASG